MRRYRRVLSAALSWFLLCPEPGLAVRCSISIKVRDLKQAPRCLWHLPVLSVVSRSFTGPDESMGVENPGASTQYANNQTLFDGTHLQITFLPLVSACLSWCSSVPSLSCQSIRSEPYLYQCSITFSENEASSSASLLCVECRQSRRSYFDVERLH